MFLISVNLGKIQMSNPNLLCELTIVIPGLLCLYRIAKPVLSTIEQVNLETFDCVNLFDIVMCTSLCNCFPIELVPCSDGWQRP